MHLFLLIKLYFCLGTFLAILGSVMFFLLLILPYGFILLNILSFKLFLSKFFFSWSFKIHLPFCRLWVGGIWTLEFPSALSLWKVVVNEAYAILEPFLLHSLWGYIRFLWLLCALFLLCMKSLMFQRRDCKLFLLS